MTVTFAASLLVSSIFGLRLDTERRILATRPSLRQLPERIADLQAAEARRTLHWPGNTILRVDNDTDSAMPGIKNNMLNSRYFLWAILALPLLLIGNGMRTDGLSYGELLHLSGELAGRLLLLTLAITPLRLFFSEANWPNWLLHRRRYFGVAAFVYALVHTLIYLDRKLGSGLLLQEAAEFAIWSGWLALAIFVPLFLTSNDASVRRLRRTWKKLHRWVYLAALLTFAHWIFVAFDFLPGLVHLGILLVLEAYRIWKRRKLKLLSTTAAQQ